jgi:hypothetical protein
VATFRCGRFQKNYSHVTRATIIAADSEHRNSVDFTVSCNLAGYRSGQPTRKTLANRPDQP